MKGSLMKPNNEPNPITKMPTNCHPINLFIVFFGISAKAQA